MQRNHIIVGGAILAAIIIGVLVFFYGRKNMAPPATNGQAVAVPFTELARGTKSSVSVRTNYLITSMDELSKLWKMIDAKGSPPTIDFAQSAVAAVFAGQKPTTGYAISVSSVKDASVRVVGVTLSEPNSLCAEKSSTTTPYELIAFPKTSLPLAHEDHATTAPCPR